MALVAFFGRTRKARIHNPSPEGNFFKLLYISEIYSTSITHFSSPLNSKIDKTGIFFRKQEGGLDSNLALVIGCSVGLGVVMVIEAFLIITITNRRFFTRCLRENTHYVGSVVTEHTFCTNHRPPEQYTIICDNNDPTDGGIYMLGSTLQV